MPPRPARPCTYPGCNTLVLDGSRRCAKHPAPRWVNPTQEKRTSGRKLQAMRAALFKRKPLCVECEKVGRVSLAVIRDHVVPLAEDGTDDDSNTQGLCDACHEVKSQAEAHRGILRSYRGGGVV